MRPTLLEIECVHDWRLVRSQQRIARAMSGFGRFTIYHLPFTCEAQWMLAADCSWRAERDRVAHVADVILFWGASESMSTRESY
jgi:hypothetical protein